MGVNVNNIIYDNSNEKLIDEFLINADGQTMHAVFAVNIDNFASISNSIGYDNATDLLELINNNITNLFRGTDIVVRSRGDEYIILINNPGNIMNVESLCEKMLRNISDIKIDDKEITATIGVSLYPIHGTSYEDLKTKAMQSLARKKADGKNGFRIYNAALTKTKFADIADSAANRLASPVKAIDSGAWKKYFDDICFKIFKDDTNLYSSINAIMEIFCLYYGFGRAFITTTNEHSADILNKMHFCIPGFALPSTPIMEVLKKDLVLRLHEGHGDYGLIDVDDIDEDPEVVTYMQTVSDSQLLYFSMYHQGHFLGGAVFENTDSEKIEIEDMDYLYHQIQEVFSYGFLIFEMNNIQDLMSKIEVFEGMDAYVYILDKKTRTIQFMNKKALYNAGTASLGKKCHEIICNNEKPCINCPLYRLKEDDSRSNAKIQSFNFSARCWAANMYSWLSLKDNPGKVLLVSVDMDNFLDDINE